MDSECDPIEFQIQGAIRISLDRDLGICPYQVIFVDQKTNSTSLLKISFWIPEEIDSVKKFIGYDTMCDKSGYIEFRDTNTIILRGIALLNFFRALKLSGEED